MTVSKTAPIDQEPPNAPPGLARYRAEYIDEAGIPNSMPPKTVRPHVVLSLARTAVDPSGNWGDVVAPFGLWAVEIKSKRAIDVQAWIKRSDTLAGRRAKGRQSYFDDPAFERYMKNSRPFDYDELLSRSYVRRMQTFSGIATGERTDVIGGYCALQRYPAIYSSHGTRTVWNIASGPEWLEPSDDSSACFGVLAAGTSSGSAVAMNGSSVAAPQATRRIADDWLATGMKPPFPVGAYVPYPAAPTERPIPPGEIQYVFGGGLLDAPQRKVPRIYRD